MTYCKNYCEEKGISTSRLNEAQKTLYYIAENMKMDKSISKNGYFHFQMAIKALKQKPIDKSAMMYEIYMEGVNMSGEYQGCWVRFKDIEKIVDKYMAESEEQRLSEHKYKDAYSKGYEAGKKQAFTGYCMQCYDELSPYEQAKLMVEWGADIPSVLDKIRAEIEQGKMGLDIEFNCGLDYALKIIDNYRKEQTDERKV